MAILFKKKRLLTKKKQKNACLLVGKNLQQEVTNQETETETEVCNFPNRPLEQLKTSIHLFYRTSRFWPQVCKKSSKMKTEIMLAVEIVLNLAYFVIHYNSNWKFRPAWYISFPWQPLWRQEQLISSQEAELTTRLKAQLADLFLDWISRMPFLTRGWGVN